MWDGVIVGGGLAGLITGIRSLELGKNVVLVSEGTGSLTYASGVFDFGEVESLCMNKTHPYSYVGLSKIRKSFDYCLSILPEYEGQWGTYEKIMTPLGTLRNSHIIPHSMKAGRLLKAKKIVLIAPRLLKDFFPELIIRNLNEIYSAAKIHIITAETEHFRAWYERGKSILGTEYAKYWGTKKGLLDLERILDQTHNSFRKEPFDHESSDNESSMAVIFPSLIVDDKTKLVISRYLFKLVEITSFSPSIRGQYLHNLLRENFKKLGGEVIFGGAVKKGRESSGKCLSVIVQSIGRDVSLSAKSFVVATGGILGGGINVSPTSTNEEAFGLPLYVPDSWTKSEFFGEQPYAKIGVEVNDRLRPVYPGTQKEVFENVIIVGRTIAHWDPWIENCGGGVSIATGYFAAEEI